MLLADDDSMPQITLLLLVLIMLLPLLVPQPQDLNLDLPHKEEEEVRLRGGGVGGTEFGIDFLLLSSENDVSMATGGGSATIIL